MSLHSLLVATDGSPAALGALRVARALELRDGVRVQVVTVVEPLALLETGFGSALPEAEIEKGRRSAIVDRVREQVREVRGSESAWNLSVEDGSAPAHIVTRARSVEADAIVLGLGRHGIMERFLGSETALRVVHMADRPVLAVPDTVRDVGHRLVAAVDFSSFSEGAVRSAMDFLKPPGDVHLVHVLSGLEGLPIQQEGWREAYREEAEARLARLRRHLGLPEGWKCTATVLAGSPAEEIMEYARDVGADILATGSHGHSFMGRLVLGSTSTHLVRTAECCVLVEPPQTLPTELETRALSAQEVQWTNDLRAFSERNEGRATRLEIDAPELGAQHAGSGFRLAGVEYEAAADRISVFLGTGASGESHVTHAFAHPLSLEILKDESGESLRIGLERGQVLLRTSPGPAGPVEKGTD